MPAYTIFHQMPFMAPLLAAFGSLAFANLLLPKDADAVRTLNNHAYGPNPGQRLDLYVPSRRDTTEPLPLLMFIPGCSWPKGCRLRGRKTAYGFVGKAFAAAGYATAIPDYRRAEEVGHPDFIVDCGRALKAFRRVALKHGGGRGPVYLVGHGAGAYNAVMLALDDEIAKRAGIARNSIGGVAGIAGPYHIKALAGQAPFSATGPAAIEPAPLLTKDAPPMLLMAGSTDRTVCPSHAEHLATAARGVGAHVELRRYDALDHADMLFGLARPYRDRHAILSDIVGFFNNLDPGRREARQDAGAVAAPPLFAG